MVPSLDLCDDVLGFFDVSALEFRIESFERMLGQREHLFSLDFFRKYTIVLKVNFFAAIVAKSVNFGLNVLFRSVYLCVHLFFFAK